jgi:sentrin-specific protease 7
VTGKLTPEDTPPILSDHHAFEEPPKPEPTTIDIEEISKPTTTAKKGKKKSFTPRKYNPKEPRIITLDSLGITHTATCTNLRDYLIAEAKSKRNKEINISRPLGMTAVKIPLQKNYCDCGLFLLSYIEEFLKCPDEFTEALLQKQEIEESRLMPAPVMRNHIRDLLFDLQALQMVEENEKAEAKRQGKKKIPKAQDNVEAATSTKSNSREVSQSARASVDPKRPASNRASAQPELANREVPQEGPSRSPQTGSVTPEPTPDPPAESRRHKRDTNGLAPESQTEGDLPKEVSEEPIDLENEAQDGPDTHKSRGIASDIEALLSHISKPFSGFKDDAGSSNKIRLGRSHSNAVEIEDDSPQKSKHNDHQTPGHDSLSTQLGMEERLSSPSTDQEGQLERSDCRHRSPTPYPRRERQLTSPDLDETQVSDEIYRTPKRKGSQTIDSSPPQSPPKPSNYVDITSDEEMVENDKEMLFQSEPQWGPKQERESFHGAEPLSSSPLSTPVRSAEKNLPATHPQRGSNRKASPRKSPRSSQSANVRQRTSPNVAGRDALEKAMMAQWKGKHTYFSPDP